MEEAATLYGRALDALTGSAPKRRCPLLLARAQAQVHSFDVDGSRQSLLAAAGLARQLGDRAALAQAALTIEGVSDYLWDPTGRALCDEALAGLPHTDSGLRARLLALRVVTGSWRALDDAGPRSVEAVEMAERIGDRRALREALRARQMVLGGPEGVGERLALGDRMVALGADGDDDAALWGRLWRFDALAQLGRVDEAEAEVDRVAAVADRMRSPLAAWHVVRCRTAVAAARGRFAAALDYALQAEAAIRRGGSEGSLLPTLGVLAMLRIQTGDLDAMPDELLRLQPDGPATAALRGVLAAWRLALGERDEAQRLFRSLPPPSALPPFVTLPVLTGIADLAAEFDDREAAAEPYRLLAPHADLFACGGAGVILIATPVRHSLGQAALTMGRLDEAIRNFRIGIELSERAGTPPHAASSMYWLARALARRRRSGDREEAAALAVSASAAADRMGMRPLHRAAQDLANTLAGREAGPLTRREREIAVLVSQGLTNRQIAALMHISERTVDSHVHHVMAKLGFARRAQIAAWVASRG